MPFYTLNLGSKGSFFIVLLISMVNVVLVWMVLRDEMESSDISYVYFAGWKLPCIVCQKDGCAFWLDLLQQEKLPLSA